MTYFAAIRHSAEAEWAPTMDYLTGALPFCRFALVPLLHADINRVVLLRWINP